MSKGSTNTPDDDDRAAEALLRLIGPERLPQNVEGCHALICKMAVQWLWTWAQYNSWGSQAADFRLSHACMTAGETASETLEDLGLGNDTGWDFVVRPEVVAILQGDEKRSEELAAAERETRERHAESAAWAATLPRSQT